MKHFLIAFHNHLSHLPQKLSFSNSFQFYNRQFNKDYLKFNYDLKRRILTTVKSFNKFIKQGYMHTLTWTAVQ